MPFMQMIDVHSPWLYAPLIVAFLGAVYCAAVVAWLLLSQAFLVTMPLTALKSRIALGLHQSDGSDDQSNKDFDLAALQIPSIVDAPLRILLRYNVHPCYWDLVDDEIELESNRLRSITTLVIQVSVLLGLLLTFLGIQSALAALSDPQAEMAVVLDGFTLALNSSLYGISIAVMAYLVRAIGQHVFAYRHRVITECLMDLEMAMHESERNSASGTSTQAIEPLSPVSPPQHSAPPQHPTWQQISKQSSKPSTTNSQQTHFHDKPASSSATPKTSTQPSKRHKLRPDTALGPDVRSIDSIFNHADETTSLNGAADPHG